jgi:hypothetical protein
MKQTTDIYQIKNNKIYNEVIESFSYIEIYTNHTFDPFWNLPKLLDMTNTVGVM